MQSPAQIREDLKASLKASGYGLLHLTNAFAKYEEDNPLLSWDDFGAALNEAGLNPSVQETRSIFKDLDKRGDNCVRSDDFLAQMQQGCEMSASRRELIARIFRGIDTDGDGEVSMSDIGQAYNPSGHPDVKSGRISTFNLLKDFLATFSTVAENGTCRLKDFLRYYNLIAVYDDDEAFLTNMTAIWKITSKPMSVLSSTASTGRPRSLAEHLDNNSNALLKSQEEAPINEIIDEFREQLKAHGANGIIGLQRKFRIMDDDNNGQINLAEFRKAIRELGLVLSESDLTKLVTFFDKDKSGTLSFDEFMSGVRGKMNKNRQKFVNQAFSILDKDGNGVLDPSDIVGTYDASKHPDVIAGRRTQEAILREFLDGFDVGGEVDGKVTKDEFENYYANVSASIDDDQYFELMMRNAWHISGGKGQAANSTNRRVLVTRADGSQSVEEIKNDLGLKADDKAGMMARLKAQGVDASSISLKDGVDNRSGGGPRKFNTQASTTSSKPAVVLPASNKSLSKLTNSMKDIALTDAYLVAVSGPGAVAGDGSSRPSTAAGGSNDSGMSAGLRYIVDKLKTEMKKRGAAGIIGLQRKFKIMDDDGSKSITLGEFKRAMNDMQFQLQDSEMRMLFDFFDTDSSGTISFEEFVEGVRDPLDQRRLDLVLQAFHQLDVDGSGVVDTDEIAKIYDCSKHPEVIAGRKLAHEVLKEFLSTFEAGGVADASVTKDEFIAYYSHLGASIDNDDYFELMIRNAWHISGGTGWAENSANRRVLVTDSKGQQSVVEIKNDLGLKADDKAGMMARLKAQGVDVTNIALFGGSDDSSGSAAGSAKKIPAVSGNSSKVKNLASSLKAAATNNKTAAPSGAAPSASSRTNKIESAGLPPDLHIALKGPTSRGGGGVVQAGSTLHSTAPAGQSGTKIAWAVPANINAGGAGVATSSATAKSNVSAGLSMLIAKLKDSIKSRGGIGFIGLQRKFRIMDDDGSKQLSLAEFKKGMKEMNLGLSEGDLRILFTHFDQQNDGSIDFEEFIQGLRDPLDERRLSLVKQAFSILDVKGHGFVDAEDIVDVYDASKHPDVIAGKRSADSVLKEFLSTFDVGGEVDGKVTLDEFINYYTNLGASIDSDDYFELMIRNAWHISGGTGWSANSANRRVLVTRADGSQSVEEIKNDLGLKADDKAGMMARLKAQGVDASNISLFDGGDSGGEGKSQSGPDMSSPSSSSNQPVVKRGRRGYAAAHGTSYAIAGALPCTVPDIPVKSQTVKPKTTKPAEAPAGLQGMISKLKAELASRGARGIVGMQRKFKIMDDDGNKLISLAEFKKAMKEMNMGLTSDGDLRLLFDFFDTHHCGGISIDDFITGLRDELTPRRVELVKQAFAKIDTDGSGVVDCEEIARVYNASKHPEVIAGRMTEAQVLTEFLETFDVGGEVDGHVTFQEFKNYYTNLGASIDSDDYFELMIRNAWHISGGTGWSANSANRRVLVTRADGSQSVEEIKNDLGLKADDKAGMMARLKAQGVDASNISLFDGGDDDPSKAKKAPVTRSGNSNTSTTYSTSSRSYGGWHKPTGASTSLSQATSAGGSASSTTASGISIVIKQLKDELVSRGAHGFIGLQRKFRIIDDDGNGSLSQSEFVKALKEMRLGLSDQDARLLYDYFDTDRSGSINFDEFVVGLRDPLTPRREELVKQAFAKLDIDGNGEVDAQHVAKIYDASKHPDVIAEKRSADSVLKEFLSTFDVGGEVDGKVTLDEFINYYTNLGASIDSDDYFELMIRNAWHISGGTGWSANSANRRVLVTSADGSESVQEIKNDLGIARDDISAMRARLRAQGVESSHVYLFGSGGDDTHDTESYDVFGEKARTNRKSAPPKPTTDETVDKLFGKGEKPKKEMGPPPDANTKLFQNRLFNSNVAVPLSPAKRSINSQHESSFTLG